VKKNIKSEFEGFVTADTKRIMMCVTQLEKRCEMSFPKEAHRQWTQKIDWCRFLGQQT
jgi:hypothetical protein